MNSYIQILVEIWTTFCETYRNNMGFLMIPRRRSGAARHQLVGCCLQSLITRFPGFRIPRLHPATLLPDLYCLQAESRHFRAESALFGWMWCLTPATTSGIHLHCWSTLFWRSRVRNDLCDWFASISGAASRWKSVTQEQLLQSSK